MRLSLFISILCTLQSVLSNADNLEDSEHFSYISVVAMQLLKVKRGRKMDENRKENFVILNNTRINVNYCS